MIELLRTNDVVALSFVRALLSEAGIGHLVMDENMSILEGSIGVIPRRVLVEAESRDQAARILTDADLGHLLPSQGKRPS
ncbi:MAG: DUF2007 domain-containing protein [Rhodobiaceae bacterium]|nr:DUF2007 domain-containing protein [Rhodobiaceae bacterium]MCC0018821.1 DUF2007 domain-containing protein [Rhodobiaceae bacterium]MCC0059882.1 DUF2007 domain-containing protein [Rhodobiaceae bacterium]